MKRFPAWWTSSNGIIYTGPTISLRVRTADAQHFGLSTDDPSATR